jgi:capsule polysaccharide export protein KpsE/RkpR
MATILDIKGKPLPPRNRAKRRLRNQDIRDLLKIFIVLMLIVIGYFLFAPARDAAREIRVAAAENQSA